MIKLLSHLSYVAITTPDVEASVAFYEEQVGLATGVDMVDPPPIPQHFDRFRQAGRLRRAHHRAALDGADRPGQRCYRQCQDKCFSHGGMLAQRYNRSPLS